MTGIELLRIIGNSTGADICVTGCERDEINLNEYGQIDGLKPISPGRTIYAVTLNQDQIEILAQEITRIMK